MKCYAADHVFMNQTQLCEKHLATQKPAPKDWCRGFWDGWLCWDDTQPATMQSMNCPPFPGFMPSRLATRFCLANGSWWRNSRGVEWANYTNCVSMDYIDFQQNLRHIYTAGYLISIGGLTFGLLLYFALKSLQCPKVSVHKHLFTSFILSNLSSLLLLHVNAEEHVLEHNPIWCRILTVGSTYFIMCNYAWMFCEGFYLHTVLVWAFVNERKLLILMYLIGWASPLVPISIYVILRAECIVVPNQLTHCWTLPVSQFQWICMAANAFFLIVNVIFLANILRVIVTKLKAQGSQESDLQTLKGSVKALIILIPLLGVYYIGMTAESPTKKSMDVGVIIYQLTYAIFTSLQGMVVALVICFLNGEVQLAIKLRARQLVSILPTKRGNTFASELTTLTNHNNVAGRLARASTADELTKESLEEIRRNIRVPDITSSHPYRPLVDQDLKPKHILASPEEDLNAD